MQVDTISTCLVVRTDSSWLMKVAQTLWVIHLPNLTYDQGLRKFQTVSALCSFILAMVLYPEVQQKAQEEIDHVLGPNQLPDFSDRSSLPYIEAIVNETLRWQPVVPLGMPHDKVYYFCLRLFHWRHSSSLARGRHIWRIPFTQRLHNCRQCVVCFILQVSWYGFLKLILA